MPQVKRRPLPQTYEETRMRLTRLLATTAIALFAAVPAFADIQPVVKEGQPDFALELVEANVQNVSIKVEGE
jgi:hypothetical protein